jgi:prevent-host-death family protein
MAKVKEPDVEYIVKNGVPSAVILPLAKYEEMLEDLHDLAVTARRKDEPLISLADVKRRLNAHGRVRR